ncbi:uncharacterized protein UHO2_04928 [Ustilago hordei]|uniref:uncharacterized protein n=1 Tax=Ustilago hordei TaxID=120017 RepID=UPI001A56D244|nr:uncharacterized protein UHO2_04928 [Ustilago hordei]SYW83011.1 uncharacterized protein UHO2_04928 [Ustilago hordei]
MRFSMLVALLSTWTSILAFPGLNRLRSTDLPAQPPSLSNLDALGLSSTQRQALFSITDSPTTDYSGQQCYSHIYDQVKQGCAREADMEPRERMLASVLLTICDLRASNQSVPLECSTTVEDSSLATCVEALSRSTRHWSSYAGYLREIPQICSSLQRWRDTELYQAATREKVKLIKMWREKLEDVGMANEAERGERGRWLGEMSGLAVRLREDLQSLLDQLRGSLEKYGEQEKGLVESMQNLEPHLRETTLSLMGELADASRLHSEEMSLQLQQVSTRHGDLLGQAMNQHLSKATEAIENGLVAPMQAAQGLVAHLDAHTDALQLALHDQHDLVGTLASASEAMVDRQQLHEQQLVNELNALRQVQEGLSSIGNEMNDTHAQLGLLLRSHHFAPSFLYNTVFVVERVVFWALGEVGHRSGLDDLNLSAWRCFRWLVLFWPLSLKLRAVAMATVSIVKSLLAGMVLLFMLLRGCLRPLYMLLLGLGTKQPLTRKEGVEDGAEVRMDLEGQLSSSWYVVSPRSIASRSIQPFEHRHQHDSSRRSRVHCPSAV